MKKIVISIGFNKTQTLVRNVVEDIAVESVEKNIPLRVISEKLDISIPTLSNYIHNKLPPLARGPKLGSKNVKKKVMPNLKDILRK